MMPSTSRPPSQSKGSADLSFLKNLRVGKPSMLTPGTSFSVESTLTSTMLGLAAILLAASSQWGASDLQCPHQGAQNFTKTSFSDSSTNSFQFLPTTTLTASSLDSGISADLRKGSTEPALILATKSARESAEMASPSQLYLVVCSSMYSTLGVDDTSTPTYSASREKRLWPSSRRDTLRTTLGLVSSQALKAQWAASSSASEKSLTKRMRAGWCFWKMASTALSLNSSTSD